MTGSADRYRQRMAELMLAAAAERAAFGQLADDYRRVTGPFDRIYARAIHIVRTRPLASALLLGLGGVAAVAIGRKLPLRGLIRGVSLATIALRSLRGPSS
ncbi:MAG TPA: hypothetical protein VM659_12365 [Dongiaceae bacterium]|nr:hypothetical protein [Dongiaceae bacterium]